MNRRFESGSKGLKYFFLKGEQSAIDDLEIETNERRDRGMIHKQWRTFKLNNTLKIYWEENRHEPCLTFISEYEDVRCLLIDLTGIHLSDD